MARPRLGRPAVALTLVPLSAALGVAAAPYQLRFGYLATGTFGEAAEKDTAMALNLWGR